MGGTRHARVTSVGSPESEAGVAHAAGQGTRREQRRITLKDAEGSSLLRHVTIVTACKRVLFTASFEGCRGEGEKEKAETCIVLPRTSSWISSSLQIACCFIWSCWVGGDWWWRYVQTVPIHLTPHPVQNGILGRPSWLLSLMPPTLSVSESLAFLVSPAILCNMLSAFYTSLPRNLHFYPHKQRDREREIVVMHGIKKVSLNLIWGIFYMPSPTSYSSLDLLSKSVRSTIKWYEWMKKRYIHFLFIRIDSLHKSLNNIQAFFSHAI